MAGLGCKFRMVGAAVTAHNVLSFCGLNHVNPEPNDNDGCVALVPQYGIPKRSRENQVQRINNCFTSIIDERWVRVEAFLPFGSVFWYFIDRTAKVK